MLLLSLLLLCVPKLIAFKYSEFHSNFYKKSHYFHVSISSWVFRFTLGAYAKAAGLCLKMAVSKASSIFLMEQYKLSASFEVIQILPQILELSKFTWFIIWFREEMKNPFTTRFRKVENDFGRFYHLSCRCCLNEWNLRLEIKKTIQWNGWKWCFRLIDRWLKQWLWANHLKPLEKLAQLSDYFFGRVHNINNIFGIFVHTLGKLRVKCKVHLRLRACVYAWSGVCLQ